MADDVVLSGGCEPRPQESLYDALHRRPSGRPRLDKRTKLVNPAVPAGFLCQLYPDAREAVISFSASIAPTPSGGARLQNVSADGERSVPVNTDRQVRRAIQTVRRYSKANGIDRLLTLTYGPPFCVDHRQLRKDVGLFIRRLRKALGCKRFPYVWVPELHRDGVRLHAHVGLGQYVAKSVLQSCWPHGFVDIRRLKVKGPATPTERAARAAHYLSKYVGKAFDTTAQVGCHRYEVGQGFQPVCQRLVFGSEGEARRWAIGWMQGEVPAFEWSSRDAPAWDGPHCRVMFWG